MQRTTFKMEEINIKEDHINVVVSKHFRTCCLLRVVCCAFSSFFFCFHLIFFFPRFPFPRFPFPSYNGSLSSNSNFSTHWKSQRQWLEREGYDVNSTTTIEQFWIDTYYYHWNVSEIASQQKPWRIQPMQLTKSSRTLYVGGTASYETVEDSFQHNLQLVKELIDDTRNYPSLSDSPSAIENLVFTINCSRCVHFCCQSIIFCIIFSSVAKTHFFCYIFLFLFFFFSGWKNLLELTTRHGVTF